MENLFAFRTVPDRSFPTQGENDVLLLCSGKLGGLGMHFRFRMDQLQVLIAEFDERSEVDRFFDVGAVLIPIVNHRWAHIGIEEDDRLRFIALQSFKDHLPIGSRVNASEPIWTTLRSVWSLIVLRSSSTLIDTGALFFQ